MVEHARLRQRIAAAPCAPNLVSCGTSWHLVDRVGLQDYSFPADNLNARSCRDDVSAAVRIGLAGVHVAIVR